MSSWTTEGLLGWEAATAGGVIFSNFGVPDACKGSLGQQRGGGEEEGVSKRVNRKRVLASFTFQAQELHLGNTRPCACE